MMSVPVPGVATITVVLVLVIVIVIVAVIVPVPVFVVASVLGLVGRPVAGVSAVGAGSLGLPLDA